MSTFTQLSTWIDRARLYGVDKSILLRIAILSLEQRAGPIDERGQELADWRCTTTLEQLTDGIALERDDQVPEVRDAVFQTALARLVVLCLIRIAGSSPGVLEVQLNLKTLEQLASGGRLPAISPEVPEA